MVTIMKNKRLLIITSLICLLPILVGAALFVLLTVLGTRRAEKIFEKVDL